MASLKQVTSPVRLKFGAIALLVVLSGQAAMAQTDSGGATVARKTLPVAVERVLAEINRESFSQLDAIDRNWRATFRAARSRDKLKKFVDETIGICEKLRQVQDFAVNPGGTDARVTELFRKQIIDSDTVCHLLEKSLADFCRVLDEHDQELYIKLKIDREAKRTSLSRSVIDPTSFKRPINAAASAAVVAVQNDLGRAIASFVASEAISAGVKQAARDFGVNRTQEGSAADFITGLLIELGVGIAMDQATDPTSKMVEDLEAQLTSAERAILDGSVGTRGFITTLKQFAEERTAARRKLVEAEFSK